MEVVHWFLERPEEWVGVRFGQRDRASLEARLAAHLREARARAYAVSEHPHRGLCETCPGRGGLCSWDDLHTLREAPVAGAEEPLRSGAAGLV